MNAEQLWLAAAIILFILEIITPGFVLANFGVAALAAAIAAWMGADLTIQTGTFVVACLISFVTLRPLLRRTLNKDITVTPTGMDALVGREALVTETIAGGITPGRVQVDGDSWLALGADRQQIPQGTMVRVEAISSTILIVTPH